MKSSSRIARRLALVALLAASCVGPPRQSAAPASTTPTQIPSSLPARSPAADLAAIDQLLASMASSVVAGDRSTYMGFVDESDAGFALEHGRWADDWAGRNPVSQYTLRIANLVVDGSTAAGELTVDWLMPGGGEARTATFTATFMRAADGWLYAGEAWIGTDAPHFRVLAAPDLDDAVPGIVADLPAIFDDVTAELAYAPDVPMQIKLYRDAAALVANTLLSLPDIRGWNEPGEALKLRFEVEESLVPTIAHEFTHFACFDRAGTQRTLMPWWLDEGIASYVAAAMEGGIEGDGRLEQVAAWSAAGELAEWTDMAVFEETPQDLWRFVYPQGLALVMYVTETYGRQARNEWLASMATDLTIDEATPAAFGQTFDELDAGFREWLADL